MSDCFSQEVQTAQEGIEIASKRLAGELWTQMQAEGRHLTLEQSPFISEKEKEFVHFLTKEYEEFNSHLTQAVQVLVNGIEQLNSQESKDVLLELSRLGEVVSKMSSQEASKKMQGGESPQAIFGLSPKAMDLFYQIGARYLENQGAKDAVAVFRFLTTLSPNNPEYWVSYGYAIKLEGEMQRALMAYTIAELVSPRHPLPRIYLIESLLLQNQLDEARLQLKVLKQLVKDLGIQELREVVEDFEHVLG